MWVPCVHRSQDLKSFPGKNHCFWIKFNSVCIYEGKDLTVGVGCRWSRAFLLMKCWVIQLETIWSVLFVGPDSTWWRSNNCSVRSREQALGYRRSLPIIMHHTFWHDYWDHLMKLDFFFLFEFSSFTENPSLYPEVKMFKKTQFSVYLFVKIQ